jgi:hypothetical protein
VSLVAFLPPVCHGGVDDAGGLGQGVLNKVLSAGLVLNVSKKKAPLANVILPAQKRFVLDF